MATLPIIDLTPFFHPSSTHSEKLSCAKTLSTACRTHGFFYLRSPIPQSLHSQVLSQARTFFLSPPQQKLKISRPAHGARGYQKLGENVTQGKRDWHEGIDFYRSDAPDTSPDIGVGGENQWPVDQPGFREAFEEYWSELEKVGRVVIRAMEWGLGYEDDEPIGDGCREGYWSARVIGYPALEEGAEEGGVSCGVHTDYGCLTLLAADETKGALQVLTKEGKWWDADPVPGCLLVNIGDMLELYTNGLWKSTPHRVIHIISQGLRVSVPYFFEPNWNTIVEPLEKCVAASGGVKRGAAKKYGDHLMEKVRGNFYEAPGKEEEELKGQDKAGEVLPN